MPVPLEVFCCYAREDQEMLEYLKKHLIPLQRSGQITVWSDTNLNAGEEWKKVLHQHLESADLILLLISPDFMASDYCYSTEMTRAIERHDQGNAHVIPILLRSVHWETAPFAKLQMIPTNATPVTRWSNRDDAFHDVIEHISRFCSELRRPQTLDEAPKHLQTERSYEASNPSPSSYSPHEEVLHPISLTSISAPQSRPVANLENQQRVVLLFLPLTAKPEAIGVLSTFIGHTKDVPDITLGANGRIMASAGLDQMIRLWDVQTGMLLPLPPEAKKAENPPSMALSADGSTLAYTYKENFDSPSSSKYRFRCHIWDIRILV